MSKRTPLYNEHIRLGAKMVDFAGWEMPVQYRGVIEEHRVVRTSAGLFDVSHMGQIEIRGPNAEGLVQYLTTNDIKRAFDGKAQYSLLCNERGTVVDDVIVYRFSPAHYIMVVNASNTEKDFRWCKAHECDGAEVSDRSSDFALLAFQGPKATHILGTLTDLDVDCIQKYCFAESSVAGVDGCIVARTGYTGEDGFEIFCPPGGAAAVWQSIIEHGKPEGILPAGLGARDTLRMEMKYSLYGHEINEDTTPLEAGLSWVVKLDVEDDFIGKDKLKSMQAEGTKRKLIGFKMIEKGIPRQGYPILIGDKTLGVVTSGTMSPSLSEAIGIGFVPAEAAGIGDKIFIDIRGRAREAVVVKTPFYNKE